MNAILSKSWSLLKTLVGAIVDISLFKKFNRLHVLMGGLATLMVLILVRLFSLQVLDYGFYNALASDQHQIQKILYPKRGEIYVSDSSEGGKVFPIATNKEYYQIYSVPKQIEDVEATVEAIAPYVAVSEESLTAMFSKTNDPYEPIEKKVPLERYRVIDGLDLKGIYGVSETERYYIDENVGSNILGFVGIRQDQPTGLYGIEGHFNDVLAGTSGFFQTERDVAGRWIALSDKEIKEATDGADIYLTVDRTLQFVACNKLNDAVERYGAQGGSISIMDPNTGKILAMCSAPDFNPNFYSQVGTSSDYNNNAIYDVYEPGSVFKPLVMASAIDSDYVKPDTTFVDEGFEKIDVFTIRNADGKVYGEQTMTQVLDYSINTGMIFVARKMGVDRLKDYVERFGFGQKTGIELDTELNGNISSLSKKSEIYMATASFGQGISVTAIQLLSAYGALANGGVLMKPYIVDEIHYADGRVEKTEPETVRQVISSRTATLIGGMLASVVSNGHAGNASVPGYYVAGKTGTAQISDTKNGGYLEDDTNHTFVGYAPADDPIFVMVVKLDRPANARFSASTAAPVFGEMAKYILQYYQVPTDY